MASVLRLSDARHALEAGAWLPAGLRVVARRREDDAVRRGRLTVCPRGHVLFYKGCSRDDGWGCAGMDAPGGCLRGCRRDPEAVEAALAEGRFDQQHIWGADTIRKNGHNTAGWNRWSSPANRWDRPEHGPESNYHLCDRCFARETAAQAQALEHRVACWMYPTHDPDWAPEEAAVVDISGMDRVPLFIVLPVVSSRCLSECEALLSQLEYCRYQDEGSRAFRDDIHVFLVMTDADAVSLACYAVNTITQNCVRAQLRRLGAEGSPEGLLDMIRSPSPLDIVHWSDVERYFEPLGRISLLTGCVFTTAPRCRAPWLGPHAPPQPPEACLGIDILQKPHPRGERNIVLLGPASYRALGGSIGPEARPADPEALMETVNHVVHVVDEKIVGVKETLKALARFAGMIDPASSLRKASSSSSSSSTQVLEDVEPERPLWPFTTSCTGSSAIPGSRSCVPVLLQVEATAGIVPATSLLAALPADALQLIVSFLRHHRPSGSGLRDLRYLATSCKGWALAVRSVVLRAMGLQQLVGANGDESQQGGDRAGDEAGGTASLRSAVLEDAANAVLHRVESNGSYSHLHRASAHLLHSLVTLGIPERILWRLRHHKARGNLEFKAGNWRRAFCHYMLILAGAGKRAVGSDALLQSRFVATQAMRLVEPSPDFDFLRALALDQQLGFTLLFEPDDVPQDNYDDVGGDGDDNGKGAGGGEAGASARRSGLTWEMLDNYVEDTYCRPPLSDLFPQWDATVLGAVSRASTELDDVCLQALTNASLCCLKLGSPQLALRLAVHARAGCDGRQPKPGSNALKPVGVGNKTTRWHAYPELARLPYKASLRVGQALTALGRLGEARELLMAEHGRAVDGGDVKARKAFRKALAGLKKEKAERAQRFSHAIFAEDAGGAEKKATRQ